jgi:hypothetical protein
MRRTRSGALVPVKEHFRRLKEGKEKKRQGQADLRRYSSDQYYARYDYIFEDLPAKEAKRLLTGWPNVDPKDRQNYSPTMEKMVEIADRYDGTLEGYVITVESGRDDARITFDGFTITADESKARALAKELKPDEFVKVGRKKWRFWWD